MSFAGKLNRTHLAALVGIVLAVACGTLLHEFRFGSGLVNRSYDWLLVRRGHIPVGEAVMVYLDEDSHLKLGQPLNAQWDRSLHARLIDRLSAAGARAIVFDVVFSDANTNNPTSDERLVAATKQSGRVILAADNVPIGPKTKKTIPPFVLLADSAASVGSAELDPSGDLIIRKHMARGDNPLSSLSWAAAEFVGARITQQPNAEDSERWLNYYGPPRFIPSKSYYEALDASLTPDEFFRDKVVFVGARLMTKFAGERKDEYPNPFSLWMAEPTFMAGAEIQATAFLNLVRGDWLVRASTAIERLTIIALGVLFGCGLIFIRPVWATTLAILGLVLVVAGCYVLFARQLILFPWLIVVVQIAVALFWSVLFNSVQLYVQKRLFEYTLGLYLSPKLVKKFAKSPALLKPGAEKQALTLFFSDIADFTSIAEGMDSDELAAVTNKYFQTAVSNCIHKTDGTVVKYIGDAIFAFWNAPEAQVDHQLRACEAALLFREQSAHAINGRVLHTRIGLHTGVANVGNFGSEDRIDYTALGESVNLASRLEGLNKHLGTDCLISAETKAGVGDQLLTRPLGSFQLKGFENPVQVHELIGRPDQASATRLWCDAFAQALNNYEQRNLEFAEMGFRRVLELRPDDGPSKFYLGRIAELAKETLPNDWVTHTVLREK